MNEVVVKMKDGRSYCGWMIEWAPLGGEFLMGVDPRNYPYENLESGEIIIHLGECISATKKAVQVTQYRTEDVNLIQRAKDDVKWIITKDQLNKKSLLRVDL